ncbi:MAG: NUDIX hydrolase [Bacteroidetes bacterium]|nr:MAG: NUDIX hydrolase [Bacteroidota bacterium]
MIDSLSFDEFVLRMKTRLQQPLPGEEAHRRMTSRPMRQRTSEYLSLRPDYKKSSVLLLLFPGEEGPKTALIVRPEYDGVHSGQLALPGGRFEEDKDQSLLFTALRETEEEIGVRIDESAVLGSLSPLYIPVSNFLVQPFVAAIGQEPQFKPDQTEVQDVLTVSLAHFLDPSIKMERSIPISSGVNILAPCYMIGQRILWGATAMMMSEVEVLLSEGQGGK